MAPHDAAFTYPCQGHWGGLLSFGRFGAETAVPGIVHGRRKNGALSCRIRDYLTRPRSSTARLSVAPAPWPLSGGRQTCYLQRGKKAPLAMRALWSIVFVLTVVARVGASGGVAPVPFIQAFYALETHEQKMQHLRSWELDMAAQNGLTRTSAGRFRALLLLSIFPYVNDAGVLDCEGLARDLSLHMPGFAEIDEPGYRMYAQVFGHLCPAQQESIRKRSFNWEEHT